MDLALRKAALQILTLKNLNISVEWRWGANSKSAGVTVRQPRRNVQNKSRLVCLFRF